MPPRGVAAARGPRAVEEALIGEVLAEVGEAVAALADGGSLARPVRVIVPSRSLREALCATLARRAGGAVVGVLVQSLDVLAREVLERAGETTPTPLLYPVVVREVARREPALARELGELADGYAPVVASVDDLLDAGLVPGLADVVGERLAAADESGPVTRERARALLRVAVAVAAQIEAGELGHRSARLARAAALLADDAELLPSRGVWVHGFADATGVQADLIEILVRRCGARLWLDVPRGPAPLAAAAAHGERSGSPAGASGFGVRLRERLAGAEIPLRDAEPAPQLRATRHPHPDAEARAAAAWARRRLDAGDRPERLAIVARDLGRYRLALRRHLGRRGVPFSGLEEPGGALPCARPLGALEELLRLRGAAAAERWLEALARVRGAAGSRPDWRAPEARERADWLHGLHALGAATLDDVATLSPDRLGDVALTARRGLVRRDGDAHARISRGRVPAADLARLAAAARLCRDALAQLPERAPLAAHRDAVRRLAARALGWPLDPTPDAADGPERRAARALAGALAELDPASGEGAGGGAGGSADALPVAFDDWMTLLAPRLAEAGRDRLGGRGAGVLVLSVMEARGRCFDGLWLLGMNRGVFPRRFSEDPLLPDALRRPLRDVLPDLPLKGAAPEEERFLFAQLLEAAPRVHVSCARHDERGRQSPASPLLERVAGLEVVDAAETEVDSLHDHVLRAARSGPREDGAPVLAVALAAAREDLSLGAVDSAALARARLAVLRELEARGHAAGPYLGFVGAVRHPLDPRRAPPYVTQLEDAARCPWQAFLRRLVRLESPADALDALPAATGPDSGRLLGNAVHAALERLADPEHAAQGGSARWPAEPAPESLLRDCARGALDGRGLALPGYANALARRAAPYVEVARALARADPGEVLGVEQEREVTVRDAAGRPRALRFRTDLVERELHGRDGEGRLRLTDYKTGRPGVEARGEDRRREQHRASIAQGRLLQAHAYTLAAGALGRYVHLAPDLEDAVRVLVAEPEGPQREAFETSVAVVLEALDRGALPPRLRAVDRDEEPGACRLCEVKLACLRGDSGVRRRLGDWAEQGASATSAERAALAVWRLAGSEP